MPAEHSADFELLDELAEDFAERYRKGERPSLKEYIDRYPHLADDIREILPAMVEIEKVEEDRQEHDEAETPAPPPSLERVGDFKILREIGRGGMGIVYEAVQESLNRHVALKILPLQASRDGKALERFRREARAAAKLHHTNIVPVFEVGQDSDVCFYAMQFIQGQGLDQVVAELSHLRSLSLAARRDRSGSKGDKDRSYTPSRSRGVSQLTQSLLTGKFQEEDLDKSPPEDEHEAVTLGPSESPSPPDRQVSDDTSGVLPGDINLQSAETDHRHYFISVAHVGQQTANGLSYAHARGIVHRDIKPSNLLLDAAGVVWITDFGLAKSDDEDITGTGDLLGTLRYMAPERFQGESDAKGDIYALGLTLYEMLVLRPAFDAQDRLKLIEQVRTQDPVRPRQVDSRIPRDLETIVLKAIDKDPARRYQTAQELGDDLRCFIDDEPIRARQAGRWERGWRWMRRHPAYTGMIAASMIALLAIIGVLVVWNYNQELQEAYAKARKAESDARQAEQEARDAEATANSLRIDAETARNKLRVALDREVLAQGSLRLETKKWPDAAESFTRYLKNHPQHVDALAGRGKAFAQQGKTQDAIADFDKALAKAADHVDALLGRASEYGKLKKLDRAVADFGRAFQLAKKFERKHAAKYAQVVFEKIEPKWVILKPLQTNAQSKATMSIEKDGSIFVSGSETANNEKYTIVSQTNLTGITALRIEAIPDKRLPRGGPGRYYDGSFGLSELQLFTAPTGSKSDGIQAALAYGREDSAIPDQYSSNSMSRIYDGNPSTYWTRYNVSGKNVDLIFSLAAPIGKSGGTRLRIELESLNTYRRHLGRFRISVAARPQFLAWEKFVAERSRYPWTALAAALYRKNEPKAAMKAIENVRDSSFGSVRSTSSAERPIEFYFLRSLIQLQLRQEQEALADFTKADEWLTANKSRIQGRDESSFGNRGKLFALLFTKARLAFNPDDAVLRRELARRYVDAGYFREATGVYTTLLGEDAKTYLDRGACFAHLGEATRAAQDFETALKKAENPFGAQELTPNDVRNRLRDSVAIHESNGEPDAAIIYLNTLLKTTADDADRSEHLVRRAALLGKMKKLDEAVRDYTQAIQLSAKSPNPFHYLERGRIHFERSNAKAARADFSEALRLNAGVARAWLTTEAAQLERTNIWSAVVAYLTPLIANVSDAKQRSQLLARRAKSYAKLGDPKKARADYTKAFQRLDDSLADNAAAYADLLWQDAGDSSRLDKEIGDRLMATPSVPSWAKLGAALYAQGDVKTAVAALKKAAQLPQPSAETFLLLALVQDAAKQIPESKQAYAKAVEAMAKYDAAAFIEKSFKDALTPSDSFDRVRGGCYAKEHIVHLYAGLSYTVDLLGNYDPYLRIEDDQGKNLAQDDDGGVGLNSKIVFRPTKTGSYRLIATSCSSGRTGPYELKIVTRADAKMVEFIRSRLAADVVSKQIKRDPNDASLWHARARWNSRLKRNEDAIADYAQAIQLGATYDMYLDRGELIALSTEPNKAIPDFQSAIKLNESAARKWLLAKAEKHETLRNWNVSLVCLDVLIQTETENSALADLFMQRGQVWTELAMHAKAVQDFEEAIKNGKDGWKVKAWRGESYAVLGELDKADADLAEANKLNPLEASPWMVRKASDYERQKKWPVVASFLHVAINAERNPLKEHGYRVRRGAALMHMDRHREAAAEFTQALLRKRDDVNALLQRAQCYAVLKEYRKRAADLKSALSRNRTSALQLLQQKAYEAERDGAYAAAVLFLTPVIESYAGHANERGYLVGRGRAYLMMDQLKEAAADFRRLNNVDAGNTYRTNVANYFVEIGQRYAQLGKEKEAALSLQEARKIYEDALSGRPRPDIAGDYADFLLSRQANWQVLQPQSFSAKSGTTFKKLHDQSLLAEGGRPEIDVYTVTFHTKLKNIRAIRLEVLPHPSLPGGGPGRSSFGRGGNFSLHEIEATIGPIGNGEKQRSIEFDHAFADHNQNSRNTTHFARNTIDGNPHTFWGIHQESRKRHWCDLLPKQPFGDGDDKLTLKLVFNETRVEFVTLGRFRVLVTTDAKTVEVAELRSLMQRAKRHAPHVRANGWSRLAAVYAYLGEREKAEGAMEKAKTVKQEYPDRSNRMNSLARAYLGESEEVKRHLASIALGLHPNTHERDWYMTIHSLIPSVFLAKNPDDAPFLSHRAMAHTRNGDLAKAARDYERLWKLEALPASEFEARFYGDFLLSKTANWQPLEPVAMKSVKGGNLIKLNDRSILAVDSILSNEPNVDDDTYVITAKADVKNVRYLLLEALPHRLLPNGGPGQGSNGNFHLNVLTVALETAEDKEKSTPLTLVDGVASYSETSSDAGVDVLQFADLDGPGKAGGRWSIYPKTGRPQWLMFRFKEPVNLTKNTALKFTMNFASKSERHNLGRFRLSVASDPKAYRSQLFIDEKSRGWVRLAVAYAQLAKRNLALATLAHLEGLAGAHRARAARTQVYALLGEEEQAADLLDKSLRPFNKKQKQNLKVWEKKNLMHLLLAASDVAIEKGMNQILARKTRAIMLQRLGRIDEAKAELERLVKIEPNNAEWSIRLAQYHPDVNAYWNFDFDEERWRTSKGVEHVVKKGALSADIVAEEAWLNQNVSWPLGWYELTFRMKSQQNINFGAHLVRPKRVQANRPVLATKAWSNTTVYIQHKEQADNTVLQLRPGLVGNQLQFDSITVRHMKGGLEEIQAKLAERLKKNPKDVDALLARASLFASLKKRKEALPDLDALVKMYPNNVDILHLRAVTNRELRRFKESFADFSTIIKLRPKDAASWQQRGNLQHFQMGNPKAALADYDRAIELDPAAAWYWHSRADAYRRLSVWDKAMANANKAVELAPEWRTSYMTTERGRIYAGQLKWNEAGEDFMTALNGAKTNGHGLNPYGWSGLAMFFAFKEDKENYEYVRSQILKNYTRTADKYFRTNGILCTSTLYPPKKEQIEILIGQLKRASPHIVYEAMLFYRAGDYKEAAKRIGGNAGVHGLFIRSLIQNKLGKTPEAEKLLTLGQQRLKDYLAKPSKGGEWRNRLYALILEREAVREIRKEKKSKS